MYLKKKNYNNILSITKKKSIKIIKLTEIVRILIL